MRTEQGHDGFAVTTYDNEWNTVAITHNGAAVCAFDTATGWILSDANTVEEDEMLRDHLAEAYTDAVEMEHSYLVDMINRATPDSAVSQAIRAHTLRFGDTFHLRGRGKHIFRIESGMSFDSPHGPKLYTQIQGPDSTWSDFAKGTPEELNNETLRRNL